MQRLHVRKIQVCAETHLCDVEAAALAASLWCWARGTFPHIYSLFSWDLLGYLR